MRQKTLAIVLAALLIATVTACSPNVEERSVPSVDNPPSPESVAAPPELSIPAPEESEPDASEQSEQSEPPEESEEETSSINEEEPSDTDEDSSPAEPSRLPMAGTASVTVNVIDGTGSILNTPQTLSVPLPASWSADQTIIMMSGGKIGEVEPCRKVENPENPFSVLSLPEGYGVFEAGGSSAVTWPETINVWDSEAGTSAAIGVRRYYKVKGDLIYGMYFYLTYNGTPTISEVTAVEVFSGLG